MEGVFTANADGSNEQQLTTSGNVPAWQSVDPAPVVGQASPPKPPSTGFGPAVATPDMLLPALILLFVGVGLIVVGFRKHRLEIISHGKER